MRKLRFRGNPEDYYIWAIKPVVNQVYDWELFKKSHGALKDRDIDCFYEDEDWEEVIEKVKLLHKDTDLGYFAGLVLQGNLTKTVAYTDEERCKIAIKLAKELIKQLDNELE